MSCVCVCTCLCECVYACVTSDLVFRLIRRRRRRRRGCTAGGLFGVLDDRDLGILELHAGLAVEHRTAFGEASRLVGLLGQLALGVGLRVRAAVLDQLQQTGAAVALHARGPAAERRQLPRVSGLHGGAFGRRKAQAREICAHDERSERPIHRADGDSK